MDEIRNIKPNGLTVASLFAGAGGSSTGYRMAGCKVVWVNEFIPAARETYHANWPDVEINGNDIRTITGREIPPVDILDGSPPCASFSMAGRREKGWGKVKGYSGTEQRTDDLFFEYARVVGVVRPKVFVAENVTGLVRGNAKIYFGEILKALRSHGYVVSARILDASYLGVPQARQRVIIVGVRSDLGKAPVHPVPFGYRYTLRDALKNVPPSVSRPMKANSRTITLYKITPRGEQFTASAHSLFGMQNKWHTHKRLAWDEPSPTILAGGATQYHPDEPRSLSIAEVKRVCSFPDDYVVTGGFARQWERMGRAVPPLMMKAVADTIAKGVFDA